jgi:hypothetical protein
MIHILCDHQSRDIIGVLSGPNLEEINRTIEFLQKDWKYAMDNLKEGESLEMFHGVKIEEDDSMGDIIYNYLVNYFEVTEVVHTLHFI